VKLKEVFITSLPSASHHPATFCLRYGLLLVLITAFALILRNAGSPASLRYADIKLGYIVVKQGKIVKG